MTTYGNDSTPTMELMRLGPFTPGRNADPAIVAVKRAHVRDLHVAPINAIADAVADAEGIARGLVPYVDPQLGGVEAEVLALLDNPSTKAEAGTGSGLLSLENDDGSARRCAGIYNDFGLTPQQVVHWNVAPAPISGTKNGRSSAAERARGARWLSELRALLPNLKVVLLMGAMARDGWVRSGLSSAGLVIPADVPHPSGKGMANPGAPERLYRAMTETMTVLNGPECPFPLVPTLSTVQKSDAPLRPSTSPEAPPQPSSSVTQPLDSELWGWWPTFEHYSAGSPPWGTSKNLGSVEAAIDSHRGAPRKKSPIARLTPAGWALMAKRGSGTTEEMKPDQAGKYERARAGGPWGNQGPIPPEAELHRTTIDLDVSRRPSGSGA
ncbi:hypothetical protein NCCP2495_27810 [Dietzia sp. NCCP-2495]|nr:hypothetical protein NCCP2495_27810 [Dietzia sp. NCCP-2495]